jgi:DNA-binding CsgD family transcriptional regulator
MNIDQAIQPALFNESQEFFVVATHTRKLCNGTSEVIHTLSQKFTALLSEELSRDIKAQRSLDKLGIKDQSARIQKFFECNYSAFDKHPDITEDGKLGRREYVQCGQREGICPYENKLCRNPLGLTNRETQIAKRIARGDQYTQIAVELFISSHTLRNHKDSIEAKINRKGNPAIASWVQDNLN